MAPAAALKTDDYVITTYRDHGIAIAKGMSARALMAELYGKSTGCSRGLGGSMHLFGEQAIQLGCEPKVHRKDLMRNVAHVPSAV